MKVLQKIDLENGTFLWDFVEVEEVELHALPEIPPPVWDERPISGAACVAATKAMCG